MSSSAPKLQPEPAAVRPPAAAPSPFCYAEAEIGGASGFAPEQAAEERSRREQADAFERGREAGQQQLRASVDAALARNREQILQTLEGFAKERGDYYRRVESEVVQLALAIARKILHREAQLDPHLLAGLVRVTLEKLDAATKVELHVPPHETTDWRHYFACQVEGVPVPEVHEDATLAPGACRIETSLGTTEVGFVSQLKEIETGLLDLLGERPAISGESSSPKSVSAAPKTTAPGR
jgi:flagellar assembly protein FliH